MTNSFKKRTVAMMKISLLETAFLLNFKLNEYTRIHD